MSSQKHGVGSVLVRSLRVSFVSLGAFFLLVRDGLLRDAATVWQHGRLFLGTALLTLGLLSFESGRYCDGNTADYYSCTRPTTYYEFPGWAILATILGLFFVVLWFLYQKKR